MTKFRSSDHLSWENLEKEPYVGKVPHRSLFDRSLHNTIEKLELMEKNIKTSVRN